MTKVQGKVVKVGDWVGFKSDIEQCGKIIAINGSRLTLESSDPQGFEGYIRGQQTTVVDSKRCWLS